MKPPVQTHYRRGVYRVSQWVRSDRGTVRSPTSCSSTIFCLSTRIRSISASSCRRCSSILSCSSLKTHKPHIYISHTNPTSTSATQTPHLHQPHQPHIYISHTSQTSTSAPHLHQPHKPHIYISPTSTSATQIPHLHQPHIYINPTNPTSTSATQTPHLHQPHKPHIYISHTNPTSTSAPHLHQPHKPHIYINLTPTSATQTPHLHQPHQPHIYINHTSLTSTSATQTPHLHQPHKPHIYISHTSTSTTQAPHLHQPHKPHPHQKHKPSMETNPTNLASTSQSNTQTIHLPHHHKHTTLYIYISRTKPCINITMKNTVFVVVVSLCTCYSDVTVRHLSMSVSGAYRMFTGLVSSHTVTHTVTHNATPGDVLTRWWAAGRWCQPWRMLSADVAAQQRSPPSCASAPSAGARCGFPGPSPAGPPSACPAESKHSTVIWHCTDKCLGDVTLLILKTFSNKQILHLQLSITSWSYENVKQCPQPCIHKTLPTSGQTLQVLSLALWPVFTNNKRVLSFIINA